MITHSKISEEKARLADRLNEIDEEINRLSDQGVSVYRLAVERDQLAKAFRLACRLDGLP